MDIYSVPVKDPIVSVNKELKGEERHRLYWFERSAGDLFPASEQEAWEIMSGRVKILNTSIRHTYRGMSNGDIYWQGKKDLPKILNEEGVEKASEFLRELYRKECESANMMIRPRNMDRLDLNKQVSTTDTSSLRI